MLVKDTQRLKGLNSVLQCRVHADLTQLLMEVTFLRGQIDHHLPDDGVERSL